ncbi:uncharacterized protein RHOBADRAFT_52236 [Rhodotorula graminis WP1]|uniref:Uncharacterized protein n=1 Tax=Rhodotorula graminis (strain WP1) TaxID=578459 RepID=A0A194S6S4_RHOGW|nr:uncharacterized protein RHOBADRAFT_52236 [Rhodotorula graminis WP1]KPV76195.1 hypothetical protein RHOBADRAFT_52236 [Rhodotorula graminis WP1]
MAPSTTLSHALHPGPHQGPPLSKRERLGTAATSLKRLVQDEWDKAGNKDPQPLPLPPLRAHSARSSSARSSVTTSSFDAPHFVPPPSAVPPAFDRSRYPPSPPDTPDLGDTPVLPSAPFDKGKGRQSMEQEEEDAALNAALEASLHDEQPVPQQPTTSETELREVLEQSRDDELARQEQVAAQEQSDLTAALLASSTLPATAQRDDLHTLYHPRSQTLPSFSATDFASSAYPPEKQREFPTGRPALPPGAGSAWDDEQREMELLAEAIRISKEEEEERLRFEVAEVEEALRRSELGATTSGDESAENGAASDSLEGGGGSSNEASTSPRSPRTQRHSWLRPPLSSKLATDGPSSPPLAAVAPPPPPRPLPTVRHDSVATVDTYRTAPEALPFSNLDVAAPAPPPRPARPAPPPPPPVPSSSTSGAPQKPSRLPPAPPDTSSAVPFPSPQNLAIPESYRDENNGSPYELPFLTPSSSLRSNGPGQQHLRPGLAGVGQWENRSGGGSSSSYYEPLSTSSHSGGGGPDGRSESSANSADSAGPPMSPLSVRNPDGTPSVSSSRASTMSSVSTATSASDGGEREGDAGHRVESLWIEDLPMFPAGLTGLSAYAGRSMSAIDETTEPASSVYATEQGGADEHVVEQDRVRAHDDGRFPDEVSLASSGASTRRHGLPDEVTLDERTWLAGGGGGAQNGTASTPRPPLPQRESSSRMPSLPPGAAPAAYGEHAPPRAPVEPQPSTAAAVAQDMHEDGLRFGHPAACSRELAHACPADGLDASTEVPARIELSCMAGEGDGEATANEKEARASRADWAIEAHSWVALVRALMWHGDSTLSAARADLAQSRSQRCAATARLEFRPDDEGLPVLRLVVALVPPSDAASHLAEHRELSVSHPARHESVDQGKGKGRAQAPAPAASPLATFALPDLLHLPTRLSSLAIQLYTLRHLAGIARATQPAQHVQSPDGHESGYSAMRELADAISALARAAQDRERRHDESVTAAPAPVDSTRAAPLGASPSFPSSAPTPTAPSPRPRQPAPEEQNARLVTRLRDRLRRLKRRGPSAPTSGTGVASSGSSAASVEAVSRERGAREGGGAGGQQQPNKLVKPVPPARATAVRRSERVLAAEDGNDGRRWSVGGAGRLSSQESGVGKTTDEQRELRYLPVL